MRIALAQVNTTVGDFAGNVERIARFAREGASRGADLVVFPELAITGYPPRDLVEEPHFVERSERELERLAGLVPEVRILVGYVRRSGASQGKAVADSAALLYGGRRLLTYDKALLAFYDVFDESRYFEPGSARASFELEGSRMAVTICEDIWNDKGFWKKHFYAANPVEDAVHAGADVILNIASSPFTTEKIDLRRRMLQAIAKERGLPVVYVNQVGGNDQLVFDGSSMAVDARGEVVARARSFEEDLVLFDADAGAGEVRAGPGSDVEAVYSALTLGTRDYVSKCGFSKALVGLSGGIDSALVATIAADALGPENVRGVGMPGPYSSEGSVRDAEALARSLGIDFRLIPIGAAYAAFQQTLGPVFAGLPEDVTEENLQARIRGNILMALSNKFGALVLSTGNKSELAVGYCTLYGDMAGGLAVIADVPKTMVYELARFVNRERERIPVASLTKPPSAELRPNQTDQDSLPPYETLDAILRAYIEEHECAEQIAARLGFDDALVRAIVRKVNRAEYKRQQAAPVLKVTAKAFGIGRRYPIANHYE
ncbi:MAG TPA: NAD+ synthase [Terriglobia bacterium]|jgi:NAD+ synthase/NAD+ synthase (glutamine-hydrolysing)|nr:NAD+ synthase [Terriglobia bacterium]